MTAQNKSPLPKKKAKLLKFGEALQELVDGKKITKLEWNNNDTFGILYEGQLRIKLVDGLHPWIISDGDLKGEDWVVLEDKKLN